MNTPATKQCPKCGFIKAASEFYKSNHTKDGLFGMCKRCNYEYMKPRRKAIRDRETPEQRQAWALKNNYGITLEQYNALLEQQGGVCAICQKPETRRYGR